MDNHSSKLSFSEKLKNKISVFKENNPSAFVFVMIIVVNILSILLSSGLLLFLPENKGRTFTEMLRFAFTLMINPSGRYQYSDYPASLIITTIVVLLGMISLTGGTVGYITSVINNILEKSANSKNKLKIKNHIVILNYNHKVPSLIYDYCFDDMDSTYIVILSEKEKDEIENQIGNIFSSNNIKNKFKNIIIRKGNPMSKLDLDNISLKTAKTVMLMTPDEEGEYTKAAEDNQSFSVSKLFMFITWYFTGKNDESKPNIIVESPNTNVEDMVREYHLENINQISVPVNYNEILGKILAITSIMPSLNDVLLHMISFEGVEIYLKKIPDSISITDELIQQKSATPLFDIDDMRVYIAENEDAVNSVNKSENYKLSKPLPEKRLVPCIDFEKSEIIIIGISKKLNYILDSLVCFKQEYPELNIHVILMDTEENKETLNNFYSDIKYNSILNSDYDKPIIITDIFNPLKDINISILRKMNSMLFLSDERTSAAHIDEKPLLFWSKLKDIENINARDCIVEVLDMQNKDIIERKNKDQVIVSDKFLSCMYAQLGKDPMRLDAIRDIITFQGDTASKNINNIFENRCGLFSIKAEIFFKNYNGIPEFSSKRECILWVYEATEHEYMPIGCVKNGVNYLFARTDGRSDDLDTCVLLPKDEGHPLKSENNKLTFNSDDEIIFIRNNSR